MSNIPLILYFYTALILHFMFMMSLFVPLTCFAMLIHYCRIVVKCGHSVPSLLLFLTWVLFCGVCMCLSAGCLCSRAKRRERRDWYAGLTSFSPRHLSALSFSSFLFSTHSPQPAHAHLLWHQNQSKCFDIDSICDQQLIIPDCISDTSLSLSSFSADS